MAKEHSFITIDQFWDVLGSAGCSFITHNKKIFRIFIIGLMVVSLSVGAITHDSTKGVNVYFGGIEYILKPEIDGMLKKAEWAAMNIPPFIQKHLSITYMVEKGPQVKIH